MKTKVIFFLAFFAMATFSVNAQDQTAVVVSEVEAVAAMDSRVEITADQLPEAVQKTLQTETYKDWTVSKAYHVKNEAEDGTSSEHYELVMKSNDRETTLRLDKDGNVIE